MKKDLSASRAEAKAAQDRAKALEDEDGGPRGLKRDKYLMTKIPPGGSVGPGGVVLDEHGKPVMGADGKPLVMSDPRLPKGGTIGPVRAPPAARLLGCCCCCCCCCCPRALKSLVHSSTYSPAPLPLPCSPPLPSCPPLLPPHPPLPSSLAVPGWYPPRRSRQAASRQGRPAHDGRRRLRGSRRHPPRRPR